MTGERLQAGFAAGDTVTLIDSLQRSLRERPDNARGFALLGLAYQQRARETGDPSSYPRSERALRKALELDPRNAQATSGLAALALVRHRFRDALALGTEARALAPNVASTYGVIGDALLELGRYDEAFEAFDQLGALKPGVTSYSRISYARELLGRPGPAIEAMRLAVDAAGGRGEPAAWARTQLGKLLFSVGRFDQAAREYRLALNGFPGYVHALDGLAQVQAARGRLGQAIRLERQAVERNPLPQFVGTLGDLYRANGQVRLAREQYRLVDVIDRLFTANGVVTDLELALFNVDHGVRLRDSLERIRRARGERPGIEADGVLAWALVRNGRCEEALRFSKRALRLGTLDASKFFHRAMIERCLVREAQAQTWFRRALRLNPHFSLVWAPVARRAVA